MTNPITKARNHTFKKLSGRCYYCGSHMWLGKPKEFAEKYVISVSEAKKFQCTAEHLVARCEGGRIAGKI